MKKFLTIMFAFCIFATAFAVSTPALAHADERAPLTGGVYYFTDNPNSYTIATYLEQNTTNTYNTGNNFHYVPYTSSQYSEYHIENVYYNYNYTTITDAYIIFECYYEFQDSHNTPLQNPLNDYLIELNTMFNTLKNNGCEIMFLCATDEARYISTSDFLDYVDFHVDNDTYFLFISSALIRSSEFYNENPITGFKAYMNQSIIKSSSNPCTMLSSYFYESILERYLTDEYSNVIESAHCQPYKLLDKGGNNYVNLRVLYQTASSSTMYFDEFYEQMGMYEDVTDSSNFDDNASFIVASFGTEAETSAYLNSLLALRETNGLTFPIYFYNNLNYTISYGQYELSDIYTLERTITSTQTLCTMMLDFIDGEDVTVYDNWDGRCAITHKVSVGPGNGWLVCPYSSSFDFTCWRFVLSADELV